jgi:hypothetical protein
MSKGNFIKISGGVAIMFSVFLFLATSKQVAKNGPEIKTFLLGDNKVQTTVVQTQTPPNNVIQGVFKLNTSASDKIIYSKRLKNQNTSPVLKVEVVRVGQKSWEKINWHTLNYQEGKLYFKLPETENIYTGKYQLIFN